MHWKARIAFLAVALFAGATIILPRLFLGRSVFTFGQECLVGFIGFAFLALAFAGVEIETSETDDEDMWIEWEARKSKLERARRRERDQRLWDINQRKWEARRERDRMADEDKVKESLGKWADRW